MKEKSLFYAAQIQTLCVNAINVLLIKTAEAHSEPLTVLTKRSILYV